MIEVTTVPRGTHTAFLAALVIGLPCAASALPAPVQQEDPAAVMARIAAAPFRYGGDVQGTVPGRADAVDRPPLHLSLGLAVQPDGRLTGEAILFTADRHLVALGPATGRIAGGPTPGTAACHLDLALADRAVSLNGVCSRDVLSGEIVSRPQPLGLLARLVTWWGDREVTGSYWLTPASFDPASRANGLSGS